MAQLDNTITVTLSAYDMLNVMAFLEMASAVTQIPAGVAFIQVDRSLQKFTNQVIENTTSDAMNEAVAELSVEMLLYGINKN